MPLKDRIETIKEIGDDMSKFQGYGTEIQKEPDLISANRILKDKHYVNVTIEISAKCGNMEMTRLEDKFNIHADYSKKKENEKILFDKLENVQRQLARLVEVWTKELGQ